ncbi:MAG: NigD-like N-terminal domain-containing protein [Bacteroidales bacterium]|nr:NigD-like N-terminal domain-containing protein [Candidatus Liminaster caballi]
MILLAMASAMFTSCDLDDDDDKVSVRPTALVTVKPTAESFILQLDDSTRLLPANMTKSPFGDKEVRALVNYSLENKKSALQSVRINWIDSIRTKMAVPSLGDKDNATYGNDPLEIVDDWVTVAEDGYLTLRVRTRWGYGNTVHYLNLLTGVNAENPYEVELRHNANGDVPVIMGDALIAFNLREVLKDADKDEVRFTLRWNSFSGARKIDFNLKSKPMDTCSSFVAATGFSSSVK